MKLMKLSTCSNLNAYMLDRHLFFFSKKQVNINHFRFFSVSWWFGGLVV